MKVVSERNRRSQKEESSVATALGNRAYHLPGYGYFADMQQYLINNHHLWGLCCRHPKHPIGTRLRAFNLVGSALCGLAITNLIWLGTIHFNEDPDSVLFKITFYRENIDEAFLQYANSTNATEAPGPSFELMLPGPRDEATAETLEKTLQITTGMVFLWTVGGTLHALYDSAVWYAAACACCLPGNRCESLGFMRRAGGYFIMFVVVLLAATASFAVVVRVTLMSDDDDIEESFLDSRLGNHVGKYEFLLAYFVEFLLALFLYYPLFQTILFTGVLGFLGCGKIRFLGGRPFEMKQVERQQAQH